MNQRKEPKSSIWRKTTAAVSLSLVVFSGCLPKGPKGPPRRLPPANMVAAVSTISVPIEVSTKAVESAVKQELPNPLASGRSERLSINLLAGEKLSTKETIQMLVSPAKPGTWKNVTERVKQNVKRTYKCLLKPWKWGDCVKTVVEWATVTKRIWVPPVAAVYRMVSRPVTKLLDRVYKVGGWVNYRAELRDFSLAVSGQKLSVGIKVRTKVSVDYEQAAVPLGPTIKLKGGLNGWVDSELRVGGELKLGPEGAVSFSLDEDKTEFKIIGSSIPGAVQRLNIASYTGIDRLATRILLSKLITKQLNEIVGKQIDRATGKLDLKKRLKTVGESLYGVYQLGDNIWLKAAPEKVMLSNISGSQGRIIVKAGVKAKLSIEKRLTPPSAPLPTNVAVAIGSFASELHISPRVVVDYQVIATEIRALTEKLIKEKAPNLKFRLGKVQAYPHHDRLVLGIGVLKPNGDELATLYLWGELAADEKSKELKFASLELHLDTKNYLLKHARPILQLGVSTYLSEGFKVSFARQYDQVAAKLSRLDIPFKEGRFTGSLGAPNKLLLKNGAAGVQLFFESVGHGKLQLTL